MVKCTHTPSAVTLLRPQSTVKLAVTLNKNRARGLPTYASLRTARILYVELKAQWPPNAMLVDPTNE